MKDTNLYWEIPSSIDLEGFLTKYPPSFPYKIDKFYYIIEYLSKGMDFEDLDNNEGFINLNAQKLQRALHDYKKYLDYLVGKHFIRTDMNYIVGEKSKGYLINKYTYHKATVQLVPIKDFVFRRNRTKEVNIVKAELKVTATKYHYLTKWFNEKLKIDVENATNKAEELFPEQTGAIKGTKKGKPSIWHKRYKAISAINKIANQEFYYSVDDNVGRFHSNLTNIKRELRNYITYDGQKLLNIDIRNSQPLFSLLLLQESFYTKNEGQFTIYNLPHSLPFLSSSNQSYLATLIMIVKVFKTIDFQSIEEYISMINSGEFYKKISELVYPDNAFDKQKIKEMIFTVFFSNNKFIGQVEAKPKSDFKAAFPSVYEIFRQLKVKNHTALAHILQRIESEIIVQRVAKRIASERPELPIFTIHDSVATTEGNEDYVAAVIKEEVFNMTGLNVMLGIERWY